MSSKKPFILVPHNGYVLIGDGRKALFLRNRGSGTAPRFKTERVLIHDNPPTREQGSDQPGRSFQSISHSRSAMEQTDWHTIEKHRFAKVIACALQELANDPKIPGFVIAAPPRTLAELRQHLDGNFRKRMIAEVGKDLTSHPVDEISKHLMAA